jgi:acetate kinase
MKILVINTGSSSLKYQLIDSDKKESLFKGVVDRIGSKECHIKYVHDNKEFNEELPDGDYDKAIQFALVSLTKHGIISDLGAINAVGHRVVHGGEKYAESVKIDEEVEKTIESLFSVAPLHNPPNLKGIKACKAQLPKISHVAVFDTAFHMTIPKHRYTYAIPLKYYEENKIRKYGFHGSSYRYITSKMFEILGEHKKLIICHIGNGSSICAVQNGKSIDTSMGFTPLQGLIMGTRSGDIDPTIVKEIEKQDGDDEALKVLNKKSGLKGICDESDMRAIYERMKNGDQKAKLAFDCLSESIVKYISYYNSLLNGADVIVFTAGLGENAFYLREKVLSYFEHLGLKLDKGKNQNNEQIVTTDDTTIKVMVIPTNEEL